MLKNKKKQITIITALLVVLVVQVVYANTNDPGSSEDPLVTLSFVEQKISQLKYYVDEKVSNSSNAPDVPGTGNTFEVIEVDAGKSLIGGQGTEVILRSGEAIAIDSELGGLSDISAAKDLTNNQPIQTNHLMIIPRNDGRGIKALTKIFVMVKGNYEIR